MAHDHLAELLRVIHDAAHHARILHTHSVIRERHRTVRGHIAHFRKRLALAVLRAGSGRMHMAVPRLRGLRLDEFDDVRIVRLGNRVRHAADIREAAVGSRQRAGEDGLLVLQAGLAQMHVAIHQAGHQHATRQVADLAAFGGQIPPHFRDGTVVGDLHIAHAVQPDSGVHQVRILNQQCHFRHLPKVGRERPCARTGRRTPGQG